MNFLNPLVLIGLAAAAIPILLHLLNLRKLRIVPFSSLYFLKELKKTKIKRIKLKQIILLILRTLLIIFIVLAFARPTIESSIPGFESYSKTSAVIIVDNSFSMDVSDEFGNRLKQARNATVSILNMLREGDEAAILEMAHLENRSRYTFSKNIDNLIEEAQKIRISNKSGDLNSALRMASALLQESQNINHDIYIITDAQQNILKRQNAERLELLKQKTGIFIIEIGRESNVAIRNVSIDSIDVLTRIFQADKPVEVEAILNNRSTNDLNDVVASLYFNGARVSQRSMDLKAGEKKQVRLSAAPQSKGAVKADVRIENDALHQDNRRYFGFVSPEPARVALSGTSDKIVFAKAALDAASTSGVAIYSPQSLGGANFDNFDIVILNNGPFRDSDYQRVSNFVKNGGSAIIFADFDTDYETLNKGIKNFGLTLSKTLDFDDDNPGRFNRVDRMHPVFEGVFKGETDGGRVVESPDIFKALPVVGGQEIISIPGGAFLSEARPGEGRLFYFAAPLYMPYSTFGRTGLFPALLYRSLGYLSVKEELGVIANAGETVSINLPKRFSGGQSFKMIDPRNNESLIQSALLPGGAVISLTEANDLGSYLIMNNDNKAAAIVSINPPVAESNLSKIDDDIFKKSISDYLGKNVGIEYVEDIRNIRESVNKARTGTELWKLFIILAIICAIAEMLVARVTKNEMGE